MARDFPGPYCSKHGISKRCLISACQPSEATFSELTRLLKVPKGLVLELFKFKNSKHLSWSSLGIWLSHIYGKPVNHTEIQQELRKMREFERKLSKNKQKDKLNDFREELFDIPPFSLNSSTSLSSNPSNSSRNADIDKQLQKKVQEKQSKIKNLKRQLRRREMKLEDTVTKLRGSEKSTVRLKRALNSKDAEIAERDVKIKKLQRKKVNCIFKPKMNVQILEFDEILYNPVHLTSPFHSVTHYSPYLYIVASFPDPLKGGMKAWCSECLSHRVEPIQHNVELSKCVVYSSNTTDAQAATLHV